MDSTNPYQHAHLDPCSRRRSLVIIFSAGVGSILALILLNVVARPPRSAPIIDVELAPAAAVADIETTTLAPARRFRPGDPPRQSPRCQLRSATLQ